LEVFEAWCYIKSYTNGIDNTDDGYGGCNNDNIENDIVMTMMINNDDDDKLKMVMMMIMVLMMMMAMMMDTGSMLT